MARRNKEYEKPAPESVEDREILNEIAEDDRKAQESLITLGELVPTDPPIPENVKAAFRKGAFALGLSKVTVDSYRIRPEGVGIVFRDGENRVHKIVVVE